MPQITLGEPILISQSPAELKRWGPWQFPHLERLADGRIHLEFNIEADSATAYGLPTAHALSADDGRTWEGAQERDARGGLLLPNGDRLAAVSDSSRYKREEVDVARAGGGRGEVARLRHFEILPRRGSARRRFQVGASCVSAAVRLSGVEETATVRIPGEIRIVREGVYPFWPSFHHGRTQIAPDGSIWDRAPHQADRQRKSAACQQRSLSAVGRCTVTRGTC